MILRSHFILSLISGLFVLMGITCQTEIGLAKGLGVLKQFESEVVELAGTTLPAVVNISPYIPPSPSVGRKGELKQRATNAGAGVIIDAEHGYIVTNSHVVRKAEKVSVTLLDGTKLVGKTLGYDEDTDLAVIKVESEKPLSAVELGDSSLLKIGQFAIAIGNPYGLNDTFTFGVISGLNRENVNISRYEDFIQTDASINPGNSGGPLLNIDGQVIGINTAIINYAQGIGFAIPSNTVKYVSRQLIESGEVERGWMGVGIDFIPEDMVKKGNLKKEDGVLVNSVFDGQPAAKAGLQVGDIIVRIGGAQVNSPSKMIRLIGSITPGQSVNIDILRSGERKTLSVLLSKRFDDPAVIASLEQDNSRSLGFAVQRMDDSLKEQFSLANMSGLVVTVIQPKGVAEASGLVRGDVITAVNGQKPDSKEEFDSIVQKTPENQPLFLLIVRKEETLRLTLDRGEG